MEKSNNSGCMGCFGFIVIVFIVMYIFGSYESDNNSNDTKVVNSYDVVINFDYEWKALTSNTPMNIIVDGKEIKHHHKAGKEKSYTITLEEGVHEIYLKNDGIYKTKKIEFEVDENNVYFEFGAAVRLTFGVDFWEN